jgi:NAD(P)-dependent dehydrogenase (short-subunit alcohol dehydrogenase family)
VRVTVTTEDLDRVSRHLHRDIRCDQLRNRRVTFERAATVRRVVVQGASALIVDLPSSSGSELAAELGDRVRFEAADVRDEDQVQAAVGAATQLGSLRVVVNCAGVATPGRVIGKRGVLPLEVFRTVIDINLIGTFNVLRLAAATMIGNEPLDGDRGVVIMTASVAAFDDTAIRVMTIAPGVMETPMMGGLPGETRSSLEALVPHPPRLGRPDEYAMLVSSIIENPLLNGEVIRLDGALRMPPR